MKKVILSMSALCLAATLCSCSTQDTSSTGSTTSDSSGSIVNENSFDDTFMENKNERSGKKQNAEPVRAPMPIIIDKQNNEAPKSRLKVKPMLPFDSSTKPSQTGNAPLPGM